MSLFMGGLGVRVLGGSISGVDGIIRYLLIGGNGKVCPQSI